MAIGMIMYSAGMSQDQYDQLSNQLTDNGTRQIPGILSHAAGPTEDGFCVVETWESQDALQQSYETVARPVMEAANIQTQRRIFDVVNSFPQRRTRP